MIFGAQKINVTLQNTQGEKAVLSMSVPRPNRAKPVPSQSQAMPFTYVTVTPPSFLPLLSSFKRAGVSSEHQHTLAFCCLQQREPLDACCDNHGESQPRCGRQTGFSPLHCPGGRRPFPCGQPPPTATLQSCTPPLLRPAGFGWGFFVFWGFFVWFFFWLGFLVLFWFFFGRS